MTLKAAEVVVIAESARCYGEIGERDGGIHHIRGPHGIGFGWEGQSTRGREVVAGDLVLRRLGNAFEIGNGDDVEAGLDAGAGGVLPRAFGPDSRRRGFGAG